MVTAQRRMSEKEAKVAHLAKMSEVADLVVSPVPPWLPEVLSDFSFDVRSQDSIDAMWPIRAELWDLLARGGTLAIELQGILKNAAVSGFLTTTSELKSEQVLQRLADELFKFTVYTAQARKSPLLVGKNGKVRAGAGKPLLPGAMSAKYVCAAIVSEVISFFVEQGLQQPSKRRAHTAAEKFWTAWPMKEKGARSDPTKGWTRYFKAAGDARLKPLRDEVRRHLSIRARI